MSVAVGIDIGGTYTKVVALSPAGETLARLRAPTDQSSAAALARDVRAVLAACEGQVGEAHVVGVACPGLARPEGDVIYWMKGRLDVLEGLRWQHILQRPTRVPVINDAQAALKAETWLGAGRGCRDVVLLTLGTGVGGAILSDGRIVTGSTGRAGHLGHTTVALNETKDLANTPGSLEDAIGDHSVALRSAGRFASTEALVVAYLAGDAFATRVWEASVRCLAASLASIINTVDPERVILGGGVAARAGQALFVPLRRFMNEYEWRPTGTGVDVVPAELGDDAGAIGAAKHAEECHDAS